MFSARRHAAVSRALLGLSISLLATGGCGGGGDGAPPAFLSLGTAPPGGAFFVVGGALAEVLGEAGLRVTPEATKGSGENIRRLASGELDFAISNSAVTYFAARGEDGWGRAYPVQAVMTLAPNVATFVSPRRHEVNRIQDLAGKRVVVGVAGAGFEHFIRPIVEAHGVTYEDFIPLYNTQAGAVDMLSDDSAAAAFLGGAVPTASIVQATAGMDTLLVPLDPEIRSQLPGQYPFYREAVIPAGTYRVARTRTTSGSTWDRCTSSRGRTPMRRPSTRRPVRSGNGVSP